jgi:hypothetical protein
MALRMLAEAAVTGLMVIVRMAEIVAGAAGVPAAAAGEIADAAGAVDGLVVADAIVDVAALAGADTKTLCHGFSRIAQGINHEGHDARRRGLSFCRLSVSVGAPVWD